MTVPAGQAALSRDRTGGHPARRDQSGSVPPPGRWEVRCLLAAPRPFRSPTAYSPGGEILLHAQQPLAQGLQHRASSLRASRRRGLPRRRAPPPLRRLSPHAAAAAPSASPPPRRARPAQPQCGAQGRLLLRRGGGPSRRRSSSLHTGREARPQLVASPGLLRRHDSAALVHLGKMISVPAPFSKGLAFKGINSATGNNLAIMITCLQTLTFHTLDF